MNTFRFMSFYHFVFYKLYKFSIKNYQETRYYGVPRDSAMFYFCGLASINIIALLYLADYFLGLPPFVHSPIVRISIFGFLYLINYFIFLRDRKFEVIANKMNVDYQDGRKTVENYLFWSLLLSSLLLFALAAYLSGN